MILITSEATSNPGSYADYWRVDLLSLVSEGSIEKREKSKAKRRDGHILGHAQGLIDQLSGLARIFHESPAATTDMAVLPGVLGCRPLRRTVQVRLGTNPLRLPGGTAIFAVSRQQFTNYQG